MPTKVTTSTKFIRVFIVLAILILGYYIIFSYQTKITKPYVQKHPIENLNRVKLGPNNYEFSNNFLQKNKYGLWELYLEGSPYEIGLANGKLTKELIQIQEEAFVEQINTLIPSPFYLRFLKHMISWFNRDIHNYVSIEYQQEIYGISKSISNEFNYIALPYERMLNYHAAHDIGHALQNLALVGCTSFASNLNSLSDNLIIGRNFDFYINEKFAENKVVAFVKPENGHEFMYVTWASMIGVVSGMNNQGLTVSLNAAKSDIPFKSATPISILAREILQYAGTLDEAIKIANDRQVFVSEQILIGSANDNTAIVIEKSPTKMGIFRPNEDFIVSSNHFQSKTFAQDENNIDYMLESASVYREERCTELMQSYDSIDYRNAISILRDKNGMANADIGIGNEKALCQMISHHGVVFLPEQRKVWVSTPPYQLGNFICYDLNEVFSTKNIKYDSLYSVEKDTFITDGGWSNYLDYKSLYSELEESLDQDELIINLDDKAVKLASLNPNYYKTYLLIAECYLKNENKDSAINNFRKALNCEFENTIIQNECRDQLQELLDN